MFDRWLGRAGIRYCRHSEPRKGRHAHPLAAGCRADTVDRQRIPDIFQALLTEILIIGGDDAPHLLENSARKADAAGPRNLLEPSGDIYGGAARPPVLQPDPPGAHAAPGAD